MRTATRLALALPMLGLAGLMAPAVQAQSNVIPPVVVIAPTAPPPPQVEVVPQMPSGQEKVLVWQPGRWTYQNSTWIWTAGSYVYRPEGATTWVPGRWELQPNGAYVWVEGKWS